MDQAGAEKQDESILRGIGEVLRRNGVSLPEQLQGKATDTPSHDKESFLERARFKDLAQDEGKRPEAVRQIRTTWRDRVQEGREGTGHAEGPSQGTWAARVKVSRAEDASNDNAEPERNWAKTVERSRSQDSGRNRPDGQERDRQNQRGGHER